MLLNVQGQKLPQIGAESPGGFTLVPQLLIEVHLERSGRSGQFAATLSKVARCCRVTVEQPSTFVTIRAGQHIEAQAAARQQVTTVMRAAKTLPVLELLESVGGGPMTAKQLLLLGTCALVCGFGATGADASAAPENPVVRIAELEIDPTQMDRYKAALREEIETSIRVEPGVLTLYAVSVKGQPANVRIFEVYADEAAYRAHLETPHFQKYKSATQAMVKSLQLIETEPIILGAKPR